MTGPAALGIARRRTGRRQRIDLMAYEKQRQGILKDLGADPYVD